MERIQEVEERGGKKEVEEGGGTIVEDEGEIKEGERGERVERRGKFDETKVSGNAAKSGIEGTRSGTSKSSSKSSV